MARTFIVSDRHNTFFTENNIKVGTQIPTEGTYRKGDIVVNIGNNTANEAMWICVEAGTPGTWEVVGAGVGGTGGGSSLVVLNESVFVNEPVNEVSLGSLVGKISNKDKLIVHHNSIHLMEGIDYEVDSEGTKIVKLTEGPWNESGEDNSLFSFELLKNVKSIDGNEIVLDTKLTSMVNNVIVNTPTTEVEIGIAGFNKDNDTLLVFKNGVIMVEGVEYNVSGDNTKIISINEVWNESNVENYGITFVVFKEVVIYNGENGSVTMDMLGNDVKDTINGLITITELNASNIDKNIEAISKIDLSNYATKEDLENVDIDLSNYATKEDLENVDVDLSPYQEKNDEGLATTDKTIVGAINELFQNANNGKELIASAIGEPLDSNDTFSAMSNDINSLLSTFKTNMMNNGVTVNSSDKFKALIDKIATLADSEGKGIQITSGDMLFYDWTSEIYPIWSSYYVTTSLDFTPSRILVYFTACGYYNSGDYHQRFVLDSNYSNSPDNMLFLNDSGGTAFLYISDITPEGFTIYYSGDIDGLKFNATEWYAIGVGEGDTTLRDSLASILQEEGVSISEEDDMASLISKVDSEFDRQVVPAGTAVATNVDKGKTFINSTGQLVTGTSTKVSPAGTAVAANVLSGKTFINSTGSTITGTMTNRGGAQTVTPGTSNKTLNAGYYSGNITVQGDSNLKAENIKEGVTIFGITGTCASPSFYLNETSRTVKAVSDEHTEFVINHNLNKYDATIIVQITIDGYTRTIGFSEIDEYHTLVGDSANNCLDLTFVDSDYNSAVLCFCSSYNYDVTCKIVRVIAM